MSFRDEKYDSAANTYNLNGSSLARWRAQLAKGLGGTRVCQIVCLGDSITEGVTASPPAHYTDNWPAYLRAALAADGRFGTVGEGAAFSTGVLGVGPVGYDDRWGGYGGGSQWGDNPAPGGLINRSMWQNATAGSTDVLTFALPVCDSVFMYAGANTTFGTMTFDVDGGSPVSVNENPGGGTPFKSTVKTGLALTTHTVNFHAAPSGFSTVMGVGWYTAAARNNVEVITGGGCSALNAGDIIAGGAKAMLGAIAPDLVVVCIGRNNAGPPQISNYKADVTSLVTYVRSTMSKDILLVSPPPSSHPIPPTDGTANYPQDNKLYEILYQIANEQNVAVLNLRDRFTKNWATAPNLLSTDDIHPIVEGQKAIGLAVADVILP